MELLMTDFDLYRREDNIQANKDTFWNHMCTCTGKCANIQFSNLPIEKEMSEEFIAWPSLHISIFERCIYPIFISVAKFIHIYRTIVQSLDSRQRQMDLFVLGQANARQ